MYCKLLSFNGCLLQNLPIKYQQTKAVISAAVRQNGLALQFASPALRKRIDIVSAAVQQNSLVTSLVLEVDALTDLSERMRGLSLEQKP